MILYFSGTGNSKFVAEKLGKMLSDTVVDSLEAIQQKESPVFECVNRPWVFVCPTYAWQIPRVFDRFIRRCTFTGNPNAYFILTCGSEIGNASGRIEKICQWKDLRYNGTASIVMPDNYIGMSDIPNQETVDFIYKQAVEKIDEIALSIWNGKPLDEVPSGPLDIIKSSIMNRAFYLFCDHKRPVCLNNACDQCEDCVNKCPTKNIEIRNGKPVWHSNCAHCMACINVCPRKAIEYGKRTVGKRRLYDGKVRE